MKHVLTLLTLISLTVSADAQTPESNCRLTAADAPTVRGLRLGTSTDDLLALFPAGAKRNEVKGAVAKAKSTGGGEVVFLSFYPATDSGKEQFAGVESVSAGLLNGRVADFTVLYGGVTWSAVDDWVAKLAETFKLPAAQTWMAGPNETPNKILRCDGIAIEAAIQGGSASIRVSSAEALKIMSDRANASDERKRREMKP